jgi:hypothetical protein
VRYSSPEKCLRLGYGQDSRQAQSSQVKGTFSSQQVTLGYRRRKPEANPSCADTGLLELGDAAETCPIQVAPGGHQSSAVTHGVSGSKLYGRIQADWMSTPVFAMGRVR